MISVKQLKYLFIKWFLSDHLRRIIRLRRLKYRMQKFWLGEPSLPAPAFEKKYFDRVGLSSIIVRRMDDYRSAAIVKERAELLLEGYGPHRVVQFAVTPHCRYSRSLGKTVKLRLGNKETCLQDIPYEKWFDVRLDLEEGADKLIVEADMPIAITMPKGVFYSSEKSPQKKLQHVIVFVLDAWTTAIADQTHPFTGDDTVFPNIKRFFSNGLQARNGVSSGQWTLPAVGSLFTGQHLASHHMFHPTRWQEFDLNRRTLPEYFQQAGYHTLCGSVVSRITPAFGHSRGFDRFLYHFVDPQLSYQKYDPASWVQEVIGHLEAHHNDSTFSYFQFPDTHPSWHLAPETRYFYLGRRGNTSGDFRKMLNGSQDGLFDLPEQAKQLYLLRLAELDRMFGCVFDYVDRHFGEKALVVVTADHGLLMPYLGKENKNDTFFLTDVRVNIPLYMRGGHIPKMDYEGLCSPNIDIPVMLLQLAGIKPDADDFDGINFINSQEKRECVISEYAYDNVYEIAVRGGGHALFLKYDIDDINFKLLSKEPVHAGLYKLQEKNYLAEDNLIGRKIDVAEKLKKAAMEHFIKKGIMRKVEQ